MASRGRISLVEEGQRIVLPIERINLKAVVLTKYGRLEWREIAKPDVGPGEVLLRVRYAGICGTDMHIFCGEMDGRTHLPMVPGHEFAGEIVELGQDVTGFQIGDRAVVDPIYWCGVCPACLRGHYPGCTSLKLKGIDTDGGFAEFAVVNDFMLFPVPETISDAHAALIEVLAIGFHALKRANLNAADSVLIWGAGRIGQCILQAVKTRTNAPVFIVDVLDSRLEIAKKSNPEIVTINSKREDPLQVIRETNRFGVDVAFEAVGHAVEVRGRPHPLRGCIQAIRGGGTVCALGLGDEPAPLLMKELIWKEGTIVASRVTHGEFEEAIQNLAKGKLNPDLLISAEYPASQAQQAFEDLVQHPEKHLKVLLNFS